MSDGAFAVSSAFLSPLRYPGGKRRLANFFKLLFLRNRLLGSTYVEAFAGGASVGLALLFEEYASEIYINDLNAGVNAFWESVLNETTAFCELLVATDVTMEEWYRQRDIYNDPSASTLARGFATFFLNRTNRSGIVKGGVIGGKRQDGAWKLDARFNKPELLSRIQKIGRFRARVHLLQMDGVELTRSVVSGMPGRVFTYFDPPYFVKGDELYENSYESAHHEDLADAIRGLRTPWVVSYDAAPEIEELYAWASSAAYSISYSAGARGEGSEIMFLSEGLDMPVSGSPVRVPYSAVRSAQRSGLGTLM